MRVNTAFFGAAPGGSRLPFHLHAGCSSSADKIDNAWTRVHPIYGGFFKSGTTHMLGLDDLKIFSDFSYTTEEGVESSLVAPTTRTPQ